MQAKTHMSVQMPACMFEKGSSAGNQIVYRLLVGGVVFPQWWHCVALIWYDMVINGMMWCDMWCDMIWYMLWYDMTWYDICRDVTWRDMTWHWHDMTWQDMTCVVYVSLTKDIPSSLLYKTHFSRQLNCWSRRCSWSIPCRRCSNYIFILELTHGFNGLGKDNYKMRRETFKVWDLLHLY